MQARELKSVFLKARGVFMKLIIHKCYINPLNLFNQVGIIALNVLGQPVSAGGGGGIVGGGGGGYGAVPMLDGGVGGGKPPLAAGRRGIHDLAVDMGLDPETAALLRDVAARKEAAVAAEDFEAAKRLKGLQDTIKSVGGQLAQLVADKARAVEDEDYDRAATLKTDITRIRGLLAEKLAEVGMRAPATALAPMAPPPVGWGAGGGGGYAPPTGPAGGGYSGPTSPLGDDGGGRNGYAGTKPPRGCHSIPLRCCCCNTFRHAPPPTPALLQ